MKNQKDFVLFSILSAFIILLSSCGGGAGGGGIFSAIEGEVKLGKKTAGWAVTSLVVYKGNLYCTNGSKVLSKGYKAGRGWASQSTSYDGAIGLLASDDNNLYILTYKPSTEVTSTTQDTYNYSDTQLSVLYGSTGVVSGISNVVRIFDNKVIGTADGTTSGREAFATTADGTTYKLNGTAAPTPLSGQADKASAVKVGGSTQLIQSFISTSDYSNSRAWYIPLDGNGSAAIKEKNAPQFTITGIGSGAPSIDLSKTGGDGPLSERKTGKISGLAYYEETDSSGKKEYLLVSTTQGYYRITLDGTNTAKRCPYSNGEQLAGMGIIEGSFWTLPTGAIYAGATTSDTNRYGLWSYYPDGVWNLD